MAAAAMGTDEGSFRDPTDFEKRANKDMAVTNEFDVYGEDGSGGSAYHDLCRSLAAHRPAPCSQVPHHGVVESRRPHACGDGLARSARFHISYTRITV